MVPPAEEVGHLGQETDDPKAEAHEDGVGQSEDPFVPGVMTDVDVPVEGDGSNAQQAAEARRQTDRCNDLAQPTLAGKPLLPKKDSWNHQTKGQSGSKKSI